MLELAYYAQNNASVLWQSLPLFSRAPENEAILKLAPRYGRVCALRIYPLSKVSACWQFSECTCYFVLVSFTSSSGKCLPHYIRRQLRHTYDRSSQHQARGSLRYCKLGTLSRVLSTGGEASSPNTNNNT